LPECNITDISSSSSNHMWQGNIYMQHAAQQRVFFKPVMNANAMTAVAVVVVGGASAKCLPPSAFVGVAMRHSPARLDSHLNLHYKGNTNCTLLFVPA